MRIWIVMTGESLPTDGKNVRLRRVAALANLCASRGHDVTWWTSTFHHQKKQQRASEDTSVVTEDGLRINMLYAPAYRKNVSIGRLINHRILGKSLERKFAAEKPPDLILCAWPTINFSVVCVKYALAKHVPVIIDVRDLWPDIFAQVAPRPLRPLMNLALRPMINKTKFVFRNCSSILAISPGYLRWALGYARRQGTEMDRVFPLGYQKPKPSQSDLEQARRELAALGMDPSKRIVWFVGVFGATYDLGTVIGAASLFQQQGREDVQFVLSGDGEMASKWRAVAQGLTNVIFTGWIDGAKISCLGDASTVGLAAYASSAPQGLPNKLTEYLAFGLPVVSSLKGEAEQFLLEHHCGLTYEPGNARSLASALQTILDNPRLGQQLGATGRKLYESELSSEKVYPAMLEYLESVASSRALLTAC
jgi:glycosyltransferase involved in cell wall biosynthesis